MNEIINKINQGFSFNQMFEDIIPKDKKITILTRVNNLDKLNNRIIKLKESPTTPRNIRKIKRTKNQHRIILKILKKEVKDVRQKGYTVTLPSVWEDQIQHNFDG